MIDPSNTSVIWKHLSFNNRLECVANLADLSKLCASTPLQYRIHHLHFEGLDVFVLDQGDPRLSGDFGYPPSCLLQDTKRGR